jgi:hypothetical protein
LDAEDYKGLMEMQPRKKEYIQNVFNKSGDADRPGGLTGEKFWRYFRIGARQAYETKDRISLLKRFDNLKVLAVKSPKTTVQGKGIKIHKKVPIKMEMTRQKDGKKVTVTYETILGIVLEQGGKFQLVRMLGD